MSTVIPVDPPYCAKLSRLARSSQKRAALMHYSGILVVVAPTEVERAAETLEALPGVEVHYLYPDSGRIIAVQETDSAEGQQDGLRRIQELEGVRMAALVEHRIEKSSEGGDE